MQEGRTFALGADGGVLVNQSMETSVEDIYAAGDVCTVQWDLALHWFQVLVYWRIIFSSLILLE